MITAGIITELYIQKLDILETTVQCEELWQKAYSQRQNKTAGNVSRVHYLFESLYVPQWVYTDKAGLNHIFDEIWMADWWWNTQVQNVILCKSKL